MFTRRHILSWTILLVLLLPASSVTAPSGAAAEPPRPRQASATDPRPRPGRTRLVRRSARGYPPVRIPGHSPDGDRLAAGDRPARPAIRFAWAQGRRLPGARRAAPVLAEGAEPATSPPGQWECWTPSGTVPCGYTLAVAGVSPVDAWAVGTRGAIMHWDDSFWQSVASPTTTSLTAVSMVSAFDGWAVGAQGVILHWNGVAWRQVDSPTTEYLTSVDMVSAIDGWAVGGQGVILHWDGGAWYRVESPTTEYLTSVDMVSAVDGWAVGGGGVIIHWDGVAWSLVASPTAGVILWSVSMVSATDGWAVGGGLLGDFGKWHDAALGRQRLVVCH